MQACALIQYDWCTNEAPHEQGFFVRSNDWGFSPASSSTEVNMAEVSSTLFHMCIRTIYSFGTGILAYPFFFKLGIDNGIKLKALVQSMLGNKSL